MTRSPIVFLILISTVPDALAHAGHLGDLAGHSHWVGLAAGLGAAALAALIAKARARSKKGATEETTAEAEENEEGAPA